VLMTLEIVGLNPERLLRMAAEEGILVMRVRRFDARHMRLSLSVWKRRALFELCARFGWEVKIVSIGLLFRRALWIRRRPMALAGAALYILLMVLSSNMIWQIRVDHAGKNAGEIRRYLHEKRIVPGVFKRKVSVSELRDSLMLRLPDLAHVSVSYEGSCLVVSCQPSLFFFKSVK